MSEPTPEAIEAAAKAAEHVYETWGSWEDLFKAALSAAAPYLIREAQAKALEEAADAWWAHIRALGLGSRAPIHWLRARAAAIRDGAQ